MGENRNKIKEKKLQLEEAQEKLYSLEEKWIKNKISRDTYERWYTCYNDNVVNLQGAIEWLGENQYKAFTIFNKHLDLLSDMRYVYTQSDTLNKREFVNLVFDSNLYYHEGIYRTPTMIRIFTHNALKMKEMGYLIYERKEGFSDEIPSSGEGGIRTLGTVTHTTVFETAPFDRSGTSPVERWQR